MLLALQCQNPVPENKQLTLTCLWDFAKPASATDYREFSFSCSVCNLVMVLDQCERAGSTGVTEDPHAAVACGSYHGIVCGQEGVFIHTCHSRPRWMVATSTHPGQRTSEGLFLTGT